VQQTGAVDLEKIQDFFQRPFDFVIETLCRHMDEARREVGNHLLESQAFVDFDTIGVVEDRATFSFGASDILMGLSKI